MTAATKNGFPSDARTAAEIYMKLGFSVVPLPVRSKRPVLSEWANLHLTPYDLDEHFPAGEARNVAVLNGSPSANHIDVDLDTPEAVLAAPLLLPPTPWIFGHASAQRSHRIYKVNATFDRAQEAFKDVDDSVLLEIRGDGGITVYPGSIHTSGELIAWDAFTSKGPVEIALIDLERAARELASVTLLARHYPAKGSRDVFALHLTGWLVRKGWSAEKVSRFTEAVALAAGDEESRARASKAIPTDEKRREGKKTTGLPQLMKVLGPGSEEIVKRVRDWLGFSEHKPTVAELPLPEPPPWPEPPGEEAFHGLAGRIVAAIAPASEADRAALLIQTLVSFGNAIGRSAYFAVEGSRHHANEYAVLVGRTSKARKGTSWDRIRQLFCQAAEQWVDERVQSGASSGEGLFWAVRDPITKQERVKERGEAPRYIEVEADPGVEDKRLLVFEPEFANVLKQTERHGNTLSVVLRQAWDGGHILRTLTKNSPAKATGAHVSLIGHITADELRRYLSTTEVANGFANRLLWICVDRSKLLPEGGHVDAAEMELLRAELVKALDAANSAGEVRRDDEARALWCEIYGELSDGKPGLAGALLARAEAHVMRLALVYALLECSPVIQEAHLLAGLALWEYCERSVRFVFGDSLGDPVAEELLRVLRGAFPSGLTRTDISNYFQRHVSGNQIGRALGLLLQVKPPLVRREVEDTGGRPSERWFALGK
jgi:hypothetical protein